ncbi:MAG: response regulator [Acidobacteriia bacterium]|nr:response regulator [Terriglobia bacterium]
MSIPLRALIIEDSEDDADLLLRELRRGGYDVTYERVETAAAMQQALSRKAWDIVLSDYRMPQFTGLAALELLKGSRIDLPFIIVSGTIGQDVAVAAMKAGAHDYLMKGELARLGPAIARELREAADRRAHKRAEEALVRLHQAVDASGEVVFMTDREGIITLINPEFTRLYGYTQDEVVGKVTPRILKSGTMQPEEYADFWRTILEKRVAHSEIANQTKDGKLVTVESSANPILDERGNITGFLAIQRDVTARKQLEDQLRQAQKMEAIGRLAGGVAHDFNNLLTIIAGYGQLILEQLPEKDASRLHVMEVLKAAERATSLTRQLLAFGRRQVLAPRVLDLNAVIADTEKMLRRLIGEDVELVAIPGRDLGHVKADPGQIEQVILNLAVNARDAMPGGGRLTIETSDVVLDEVYADQHVSVRPGLYVMLAVSDTGCGMSPETQAHLFEPFFTTKEKGKGTGLGLATVYGIVKQSGGYIWVYSELGQGTTFKVYLPKILEPVEARQMLPTESASAGGSETILLVEDDSSVRSLVHAVLEPRGYKLLVARDGNDALFLCEQHKGPINLLLTDVVMPGMSGRELAERLSPLHREMKVLYMSGYADNAIVHHGVLDANVRFVQKPFSPPALAKRVRLVLDEKK